MDSKGKECGAVIITSQKDAHEPKCPHRVVGCVHEGCDELLPYKELARHTASCEHRKVQCKKCKQASIPSDRTPALDPCLLIPWLRSQPFFSPRIICMRLI